MTGDESRAELEALTDDQLMERAAEWISAACTEHYDGGGPMPSEIEGNHIAAELFSRAEK